MVKFPKDSEKNNAISYEDQKPTSRPLLPVIFVLDTSGSMSATADGGTPISILNRTMEETIRILGGFARSNADVLLKFGVLQFDSNVKWMQPKGLEEFEDFVYQPLTAGGLTSLGAALTELDSKLSRSAFLTSTTGHCSPIIIFMTDGAPTDKWSDPLKKLVRSNTWYQNAIKIGFAVGALAKTDVLTQVVGNPEAVIQTNDLQLFSRLLSKAALNSAMIGSRSHLPEESEDGGEVVKKTLEQEGKTGAKTGKELGEAVNREYLPEEKTPEEKEKKPAEKKPSAKKPADDDEGAGKWD